MNWSPFWTQPYPKPAELRRSTESTGFSLQSPQVSSWFPGSPLGLLKNAVQVLAGVFLPSATVFLLLLSNDKAALGPRTNVRPVNIFTGIVIAVLGMLSVILTASAAFPSMSTTQILWILDVGTLLSIGVGIWTALTCPEKTDAEALDRSQRDTRSDARSPSCRGIPLHRPSTS